MENAEISIVVPVYNVEKYLPRCLDSLLHQEGNIAYEIICVNDASPDGSRNVLEAFQSQYEDKLKIIDNPINIGLGASRDRGLQEASGRYVMFVDSDDYVKSDYLRTYYDAMKGDPCDILIGGYISTDGKRESIHISPPSKWTMLSLSSACMKLFKRSFLQDNELRFTEIRYAEDTFMSLCAFILDPNVRFIDYAGYYYYDNSDSITRHISEDKHHEILLGKLYKDFLAQHNVVGLSEEQLRMVEYSYISDMLNTLLVYNRGCGWENMKKKLAFFLDDLNQQFPDYQNNPFIGIKKPKGQRFKIHLGVSGFAIVSKLRLEKALFWIASL